MVRDGDKTDFSINETRSLYFHNRLCVPDEKELKKKLLFEVHNWVFTMHPGDNKMYQDLKHHYLTNPLPFDRESAGNSTVTSQPSSLD